MKSGIKLNTDKQFSDKKKYGSLSHSLIFSYLILAVLPLMFVSWFSYQQTLNSLKETLVAKLTQSTKLSQEIIDNWFYYRFADLDSLAESRNNIILLDRLSNEFLKSKLNLKDYVDSFEWTNTVNSNKNSLISFQQRYDYVEDLYLIDKMGNILYSIDKKNDLGTNIFFGDNAKTKFSIGVRKTLESGKNIFSDLEYYQPSGDQATGFITTTIFNDSGEVIGVFAIQLKLNRLLQHFSTVKNIHYLHHYIINNDGVLITPINEKEHKEVLRRKIKVEQYGHRNNEPKEKEENISHQYIDPDNNLVIGMHKTITINNINWILISEINHKEAYLPVNNLFKLQVILVFFSIIFISIFAYFYSRRITKPLVELAQASMDVAMGESKKLVKIDADNEIGQLSESFNHMIYLRKEYENSLVENQAEIKQALDDLKYQKFALDQHAIVSITNFDGIITYANLRFNDICGYTQDEIIGSSHKLLKSDVHDNAFFNRLYEKLSSGETWRGEICNKAKNGNLYWVAVTIVPYLDAKGHPESYISIATDITLQKQAKLELIEAKNIAEAAVLAKNEFLASMSYEIRSPISDVIGMLSLMLESPMSDEQRYRADIAQSSANSLLTVIDNITDYSKIEIEKLELDIIDFNLLNMLNDFIDPITIHAHTKKLELILNIIDVEEPMIKADMGKIRQILSNLVNNAIKHTDTGEIIITVRLHGINNKQMELNISVKDTGCGLSEIQSNAINELFENTDINILNQHIGNGLGLAIANKLGKLMKGTMHVSSQPGTGSTFNISLLVDFCINSKANISKTDISSLTILVVDDNRSNRDLLNHQLTHWGAKVFDAIDGDDALTICDNRIHKRPHDFFDIAFIDMTMPDMNGLNLGKILSKNVRFKNMILILMTSVELKLNISQIIDAGFSGYFTKPAKKSDIIDALSLASNNDDKICLAKPLTAEEYKISSSLDVSNKHYHWPINSNILLVEDNLTNQLVAQGILNKLGLSVVIAANGLEALTELETAQTENAFSLILMDCQMPEMDGYEATKAIRNGQAGEANKDIIIVAMTANAMQGDREKCIDSGMNDYFTKPIDVNLIIKILQSWLFVKPKLIS